jgi:hypothetical protein
MAANRMPTPREMRKVAAKQQSETVDSVHWVSSPHGSQSVTQNTNGGCQLQPFWGIKKHPIEGMEFPKDAMARKDETLLRA